MSRRRRPKRYDGQAAVVTGASAGIGRTISTELANRGATVIGVARRAPLLATLESELRVASASSRTQVCDVGDTAAFEALLAAVEDREGRIDLLVNDAAIEAPTPVGDGFGSAYHDIMQVNYFGLVAGTLAVLPGMLARRTGIIVNVSSDSARAPEALGAAYAASKAAVSAFSEAVAHEVANRGVHVHVLYPAWVPTEMGMSGIGEPSDLPPKAVRRSEDQIAELLLERIGEPRMEINAALLPLLAPIGRTLAPRAYQRAMRARAPSPPERFEPGDG